MRWFFPSFSGDFRLEPDGHDRARLLIIKPTLHEQELLAKFLAVATELKWTDRTRVSGEDETIVLKASVADAGKELIKVTRPRASTLTGVVFRDGRVEVAEGSASAELEDLVEKASKPAPEDAAGPYRGKKPTEPAKETAGKAAASVKRPTPSCPACSPGAVEPATEVLLSFLTPAQHADWASHRAIVVHGGTTGTPYLLMHRHSPGAIRNGRICFDTEARATVHFHDNSVPPEEEVLAAKLILEHREAWLRNEATCLGRFRDVLKNPFGDVLDGIPDARFTQGFGEGVAAVLGVDPRTGRNRKDAGKP